MKRNLMIVSAFLAIGAMGCGGGLTDEQKRIFGETNKSAHNATGAGKSLSNNQASVTINQEDPQASGLSDAIRSSSMDCKVDGLPEGQNFTFSVSGDKCPVYTKISSSSTMQDAFSTGAGNFKMSIEYRLIDSSYASYNDVTAFNFNFNMNVFMGSNSGSVNGTISGNIVSQKYGDVKLSGNISGSGDQNGGSGEMVMNYQFPDFTAEVKVSQDSNGTQIIELNGEEMSPEQFVELSGGTFADPRLN